MRDKNQHGFAITLVLLGIIIASLIGFAGFYYESRKQDNGKTATVADTDRTQDWKTYQDPAGFYEFKYPTSWALPPDAAKCRAGLVMLGVNSGSAGTCELEGHGQMQIQAVQGKLLRSTFELIAPYFNENEVKSDSINVNGVAGLKQTGTLVSPSPAYPALVAGDKILVHIFEHQDYTYVASYNIRQNNPFPDAQKDFEKLVIDTLKFKQ